MLLDQQEDIWQEAARGKKATRCSHGNWPLDVGKAVNRDNGNVLELKP